MIPPGWQPISDDTVEIGQEAGFEMGEGFLSGHVVGQAGSMSLSVAIAEDEFYAVPFSDIYVRSE